MNVYYKNPGLELLGNQDKEKYAAIYFLLIKSATCQYFFRKIGSAFQSENK